MFASQVMIVIMGLLAGHGMDWEVLEIIAMAVAQEDAMILVPMDAFTLVAKDVELNVAITAHVVVLKLVMQLVIVAAQQDQI